MTYIIAIVAVSAAYIIYLYWTAPVGYEDEKGFHYGEQ